jgi:hypothetical protein
VKPLSAITCRFASTTTNNVMNRVSVSQRVSSRGETAERAILATVVRLHAGDGCAECQQFTGDFSEAPFGVAITIPPTRATP